MERERHEAEQGQDAERHRIGRQQRGVTPDHLLT
jgi:hypothetical protein